MSSRTRIIDTIERTEREDPICPQCHEPTAAVAREDGMWLVCTSLSTPKSALRRLMTIDPAAWHTNRPIAGLEAAA
jgi:ribosomal protein L37AE/L43A